MNDNCDMNLFNPENMEIKPGNINLFIPVGSKMTVSASVDSLYCIGLRASDRDIDLKMSREQAVKLARGILTLSGEERPQGDLISREALKKTIEQGEGFSWDSYGKDDLCVRKKYIDNAPTVEERPQGEWIIVKSPLSTETIVKCPYCKDEFIGNGVEDYNFCPICGAQMKRGGET